MSTLDYHLAELAIATSKDDPRRVVPDLPSTCHAVLDVGCGVGQTLAACDIPPATLAVGIDIDDEPLRYGRQMTDRIQFVRGGGERLPFAAKTFDVVLSRVALPYMHIPSALAEFARVSRPGGNVWLTLHPFSMTRAWLWQAVRTANPKGIVYQGYSLANGLLLHACGMQVRFPLNRSRCESFQTARGMTKALHTAGFRDVTVAMQGQIFVVTAVRR